MMICLVQICFALADASVDDLSFDPFFRAVVSNLFKSLGCTKADVMTSRSVSLDPPAAGVLSSVRRCCGSYRPLYTRLLDIWLQCLRDQPGVKWSPLFAQADHR